MKLQCRECGMKIIIREENEDHNTQREGFFCCKRCQEKNKKYQGWQSTMRSGGGKRGRHTRVHYAPHVIGGFR